MRIVLALIAGALGGVLAVEVKERWRQRRWLRQFVDAVSGKIEEPGVRLEGVTFDSAAEIKGEPEPAWPVSDPMEEWQGRHSSRPSHIPDGPTFLRPEEIIARHKEGRLDPRQGVVSLARIVEKLVGDVRVLGQDVQRLRRR